MIKVFVLILPLLLILVSGCTTETGQVVETTKLTISGSLNEGPESIEDVRREFEEFEKSQTENLSEQNENPEEAVLEETEEAVPEEEAAEEETPVQNETVQKHCPSCSDSNPCTEDSCSEQTDYECVHEPIVPCCGNTECEESEDWDTCPEDCECALDCGPCKTPDSESCSCLPETECIPDGCCPADCAYPEDPDCPRPSVVFSEIQYNILGDDSNHEWFEIYNNGSVPIEVTNLRFEESGTQHTITSITETTLNPDSYCAIAENATQFMFDYPGYRGLLFDSYFSLRNSGEELILMAGKDGETMDSLLYSNAWGGDGTGFSLEKIDLNGPNTAENWNQSTTEKGTPGQKNSISP